MRYCIILFLLFAFLQGPSAFTEEQITINTYYPAPFGVYRDVDIHRNLTFKDPDTGTDDVVINTDGDGNILIDAPGNAGNYQIEFVDVDRPFCYLLSYSPSAVPTYCEISYVAASFLDNNKLPVDPSDLPANGFIVCVRGWE